jgi:hypothetical protein
VNLLSLKDCETVVSEVTPMYKRPDTDKAEFDLISYYRPYLNEKDNPNSIPLPEKYKRDIG